MKSRSLLNPLRWIFIVLSFIRDVYRFARNHFESSIRLQLIVTFVLCMVAALFVRSLSSPMFEDANKYPVIDYSSGVHEIDSSAQSILYDLSEGRLEREYSIRSGAAVALPSKASTTAENAVQPIIDHYSQWNPNMKILILDLNGNVLFKSKNATESQVDLHGIIRNAMDVRINDRRYQNQEYSSFYPVDLKDQKAYLVVSGLPSPNIVYLRGGTSPMPNMLGVITFIVLFFWITKRKIKYIGELASGLREISKGNLDYRVETKSRDELGSLASSINLMTAELQLTIEEERRAEQTKNELITNVSHDLRTPLTLIMGYLRLLKDRNYESEQQAESYVHIAFSKSEKLKSLIDDLFEYTKLSNKGETLKLDTVCLNELLEQLLEEMVGMAEDNRVSIVRAFPPEKLKVHVDADKMIRVFDNLLTNAVKYSFKPGTIRVLLFREADYVNVRISNNGAALSQEELERLFDRFYRVDASRSSETGGTGLGLAIAKSIIDYHGGQIWAECEGDEIRFWVRLKLA